MSQTPILQAQAQPLLSLSVFRPVGLHYIMFHANDLVVSEGNTFKLQMTRVKTKMENLVAHPLNQSNGSNDSSERDWLNNENSFY